MVCAVCSIHPPARGQQLDLNLLIGPNLQLMNSGGNAYEWEDIGFDAGMKVSPATWPVRFALGLYYRTMRWHQVFDHSHPLATLVSQTTIRNSLIIPMQISYSFLPKDRPWDLELLTGAGLLLPIGSKVTYILTDGSRHTYVEDRAYPNGWALDMAGRCTRRMGKSISMATEMHGNYILSKHADGGAFDRWSVTCLLGLVIHMPAHAGSDATQ